MPDAEDYPPQHQGGCGRPAELPSPSRGFSPSASLSAAGGFRRLRIMRLTERTRGETTFAGDIRPYVDVHGYKRAVSLDGRTGRSFRTHSERALHISSI